MTDTTREPQPKPEGPTVMEIIELADEIEAEGLGQVDLVRRALTRWALLAQSEPKGPTDEEIFNLVLEHNISYSLIDGSVMRSDALLFARAVLSRWGRPEPEGSTDKRLIHRLLLLAEQAVNEALDFDYGDPEDRYIWRELQELKQLAEKVA